MQDYEIYYLSKLKETPFYKYSKLNQDMVSMLFKTSAHSRERYVLLRLISNFATSTGHDDASAILGAMMMNE